MNNWNHTSFYRIIASISLGLILIVILLIAIYIKSWNNFHSSHITMKGIKAMTNIDYFHKQFFNIVNYANAIKSYYIIIILILLIVAFFIGEILSFAGDIFLMLFFNPIIENNEEKDGSFEKIDFRFSNEKTLSWQNYALSIGTPQFKHSEVFYQLSRFFGGITFILIFSIMALSTIQFLFYLFILGYILPISAFFFIYSRVSILFSRKNFKEGNSKIINYIKIKLFVKKNISVILLFLLYLLMYYIDYELIKPSTYENIGLKLLLSSAFICNMIGLYYHETANKIIYYGSKKTNENIEASQN